MDARTHTMSAGDLVAVFLPERGMLGISLRHRGEEILRLADDLDDAAAQGRSVGIPINHPWANRLRGTHYSAAGRDVELDPQSPWLLRDWNDVIIHGVPWSKLDFREVQSDATSLTSRMHWNRPELLDVFPFEHELEIRASLDASGVEIATTVIANGRDAVPVSFGFHPYIAIPGLPRQQWQLDLPPMQAIVLDERLLPTGRREPFPAVDARLADRDFDHGFALGTDRATMSIAGNGRCVSVDFLEGFPYAQIYAPPDHDHISLEPMTAPTNALVSGEDLRLVEPGGRFTAVFRIRVEASDTSG